MGEEVGLWDEDASVGLSVAVGNGVGVALVCILGAGVSEHTGPGRHMFLLWVGFHCQVQTAFWSPERGIHPSQFASDRPMGAVHVNF